MKKKECPSCAMEVDDQGKVCPVCGYEFPRGSKLPGWVIVALAILLLLILLLRLL